MGSYQPNTFGLYDVLGNLWEWVDDYENGSYQGAPSDGSSWYEWRLYASHHPRRVAVALPECASFGLPPHALGRFSKFLGGIPGSLESELKAVWP